MQPNILILTLAAYRLAQFIVKDTGPLSVFENLRTWVGRQAFKEQKRNQGAYGPWQSLGEGINCIYCTGVWMAAFTLLLHYLNLGWLLNFLAIAGGQAFLEGLTDARRSS